MTNYAVVALVPTMRTMDKTAPFTFENGYHWAYSHDYATTHESVRVQPWARSWPW